MEHKRARDRAWQPTPYQGIERCLFRNHDNGGRSSLVRLAQGADFPRHRHLASEEVLVISGRVRIGEAVMEAGDYLFTSPGEEHAVHALSEAVIFVSSQGQTPLAQDDPRRG